MGASVKPAARRQHVQVGGIGQPEPRLERRREADLGLGPGGAHLRDLAPGLHLAHGAELAGGERPFLEDPLGPERLVDTLRRDPQQHLPHHRGIEHAGVEQDLHSRNASALR